MPNFFFTNIYCFSLGTNYFVFELNEIIDFQTRAK